MKNEKNLRDNIISTLSFFHIFHHSLSKFEIWKFLLEEKEIADNKCLISEIVKNMEDLKREDMIQEKNGFYSLNFSDENKYASTASEETVNERTRKARLSEDKYKKALRIIKILKCIPSIAMIGICNSLSFNNADEKSDIDLLIITEKKKIWLSRLITVTILKLMNLRPTPGDSSDKICASFFISENKLNLKDIKVFTSESGIKSQNIFRQGEEERKVDIYLIYWIATLVPIYDKGGNYEKFIGENQWIKKYLPNWRHGITARARILRKRKNLPYFILSLFLCIISESSAKKIQMAIMPKELKQIAGKGSNVIINDNMLKFHNNDKRLEYYNKWIHIKDKLKTRILNKDKNIVETCLN